MPNFMLYKVEQTENDFVFKLHFVRTKSDSWMIVRVTS